MKRAAAPLFLLLVATSFLWRVFLSGEFPFFGDVVDQFMPWKLYAREELLAGRMPLWNPYRFAGAPFLANMQSAVLYPLDLLLLPFPLTRAFGLSLWLHTFLAGLFASLLARDLGVSRSGSALGGLAYMLSGFFMIHVFAGNLLTAYAAAWIPLLLLLGKRAADCVLSPRPARGLARLAVWASPAAALQILCGHPQMTFYSFFFAALLAGLVALWKPIGPPFRRRIAKAAAAVVAALALLAFGTALAAVQVVPTAEYAIHSSRSTPLSYEEAVQFTFSPDRLIELLVPEFFGTRFRDARGGIQDSFWSPRWRDAVLHRIWVPNWKNWSSVYVGTLAFLLAVYGMLARKREGDPLPACRGPLLVFLALALLLSFGPHTPVFRLFFLVPGFKHFRAPSKFTPYMLAALCVFAGAGLDRAVGAARRSDRRWGPALVWAVALALIGLLTLLGFAFRDASPVLKTGRTIGDWVSRASLRAFLFAACGGLVLLGCRKKLLSAAAAALVLLILHGAEMVWLGDKYLTLAKPVDWRAWQAGLSEAHAAAAAAGAFRDPAARAIIDPRLGPPEAWAARRVATVAGYDPMQVGAFVRCIARAEGWDPAAFRDALLPTRFDAPEYDLLNVRYVLMAGAPEPAPSGSLTVLAQSPGLWVAERDPFPRAFWLSPEQLSPRPPFRLRALDKQAAANRSAVYERLAPGDIRIRLDAPADGYLFLSEVFFPGWKAERFRLAAPEDAWETVPVRRVNGLFRLLPVTRGDQLLRLRYRPLSFRLGCAVSIIAAIGWIALLVLSRARPAPNVRPAAPPCLERD